MPKTTDLKIQQVVSYFGHNMLNSGSVNLNLKASYSNLRETVLLTQMLNNDVEILARIPGQKAKRLGIFLIKKIQIDDDGESKITFNGLSEYIEMNNLNLLPLRDSDVTEFKVLYKTQIEHEENVGVEQDE